MTQLRRRTNPLAREGSTRRGRHNFVEVPRIRSESPAFDLHHPDIALSEYPDSGAGGDGLLDAGEDRGRVENLQEQARRKDGDDDGSTGER